MAVTETTSSTSSSSALAGSGTLSSPGLGSGLDVNSIVSKLMAIERQPIDKIDTKTLGIKAELTAYGTLQGALASLQTAAQTLKTSSTYSATKATVADTTLLSAVSSSTSPVASYTVLVERLAKAEKLQSPAFSSATDSVGTGSLTFDFGTYSTDANGITSFAPNTGKKSVTFTIPSGGDSLSNIASAINAGKAGISATVLNDGTNNYLSFSSTDPGVANSLRITVDDDDGDDVNASGLSRLAFNKTSGYAAGTLVFAAAPNVAINAALANNQFTIDVDGNGTPATVTLPDGAYNSSNIVAALQGAIDGSALGAGKVVVSLDASNQVVVSSKSSGGLSSVDLSAVAANSGLSALFGASMSTLASPKRMTETVAPQDAKIWVDGVAITKSTNTITDAIQGMTISLTKESVTATTVSVARDTSSIGTAIEGFVKAYNTAAGMLSQVLAYNPATGEAGALQSEGTVRTVQAQIKSALQRMMGGSGVKSLTDVGVSFQRDGTLTFDSLKLQTALSDPAKDVGAFFIGNGTDEGIATRLHGLLTKAIGSGGLLATRTEGLNDTLTRYAKQRAELQSRMASIENRFRKQFSDLDTLMASMSKTSSFLTQQLASLPNLSGSK